MERVIHNAYMRNRVILMFDGKSRTKSSFMKDCDINRIVARGEKNGVVDHTTSVPAMYGDTTTTNLDFQESMNIIIEAESMFSSLSSRVRRRFNNDPSELLEFVHTEGNEDELRELGLIEPEKLIKPPVVVSNPAVGNSPTPLEGDGETPPAEQT